MLIEVSGCWLAHCCSVSRPALILATLSDTVIEVTCGLPYTAPAPATVRPVTLSANGVEMACKAAASAANCAAVIDKDGMPVPVSAIDDNLPLAAKVCSPDRLALTLAALSDTAMVATWGCAAIEAARLAGTALIARVKAEAILLSAFASALNCAAVSISVGAMLSVSIIDDSFPPAAKVCKASRLAPTLAPLSASDMEVTWGTAAVARAAPALTPLTVME